MSTLYPENTSYEKDKKPTSFINLKNFPSPKKITPSIDISKFQNLNKSQKGDTLSQLAERVLGSKTMPAISHAPEILPNYQEGYNPSGSRKLSDVANQYPDDFILSEGSQTPSDQAIIKGMGPGRGEVMLDPLDINKKLKVERKEFDANLNQQLKGSQSSIYDVDHIIPLWLDGPNTLENMENLTKFDHDRKSKIQAVILTLYKNGELTKEQALPIAMNWNHYSDDGIPDTDGGIIPLSTAQFHYNKWTKKQNVVEGVIQSSKKDNKIGDTDLNDFSILGFGRNILGVISSYASKPINAITNILPKQARQVLGSATKSFTKEATWGAISAPKTEEEKEENIENMAGELVGSLGGFLVGFGKFKALKELATAILTAKGIKKLKGAEVTADTLGKVKGQWFITPETFKAGSQGEKIIGTDLAKAITEIKRKQLNKRMIGSGDVISNFNKIGEVGYMKDAIAKGSKLKDVGAETALLTAYGQLNSMIDPEVAQLNAQRAIFDVITGGITGFAGHDPAGYAKVFTGLLGTSYILGDNPTDAVINATVMTGLHAMGHKGELNLKEYQKLEIPLQIEKRATEISKEYLNIVAPKTSKRIRKDKIADEGSLYNNILKEAFETIDTDGRLSFVERANEKIKVQIALKQLSKGGMTKIAREAADIKDMQSVFKGFRKADENYSGDYPQYSLESSGMKQIRSEIYGKEEKNVNKLIRTLTDESSPETPTIRYTAATGQEKSTWSSRAFDVYEKLLTGKKIEHPETKEPLTVISKPTIVLVKNDNPSMVSISKGHREAKIKTREAEKTYTPEYKETLGDYKKNIEVVIVAQVRNSSGKSQAIVMPIGMIGSKDRLTSTLNEYSFASKLKKLNMEDTRLNDLSNKDSIFDLMESNNIDVLPVKITNDIVGGERVPYTRTKEGKRVAFLEITQEGIDKGRVFAAKKKISKALTVAQKNSKVKERSDITNRLAKKLAKKESEPVTIKDIKETPEKVEKKIRTERIAENISNTTKKISKTIKKDVPKETKVKELMEETDNTFSKEEIEEIIATAEKGTPREITERFEEVTNTKIEETNKKIKDPTVSREEKVKETQKAQKAIAFTENLKRQVNDPEVKQVIAETENTNPDTVVAPIEKPLEGKIDLEKLAEPVSKEKVEWLRSEKKRIESEITEGMSDKDFVDKYYELAMIENSLDASKKNSWKSFSSSDTKGKKYFGATESLYKNSIFLEKQKLKNATTEEEKTTINNRIKELEDNLESFDYDSIYKEVHSKMNNNEYRTKITNSEDGSGQKIVFKTIEDTVDYDTIEREILQKIHGKLLNDLGIDIGIDDSRSIEKTIKIALRRSISKISQQEPIYEIQYTIGKNGELTSIITTNKMANGKDKKDFLSDVQRLGKERKAQIESDYGKLEDDFDLQPIGIDPKYIDLTSEKFTGGKHQKTPMSVEQTIYKMMLDNNTIPLYISGNSLSDIKGIHVSKELYEKYIKTTFDALPTDFITEIELKHLSDIGWKRGEKITDDHIKEIISFTNKNKREDFPETVETFKKMRVLYIDHLGFNKETFVSDIVKRSKIFAAKAEIIRSKTIDINGVQKDTIPVTIVDGDILGLINHFQENYSHLKNKDAFMAHEEGEGMMFVTKSFMRKLLGSIGSTEDLNAIKPFITAGFSTGDKQIDRLIIKGLITVVDKRSRKYFENIGIEFPKDGIVMFSENVKKGLYKAAKNESPEKPGIKPTKVFDENKGRKVYNLDLPLSAFKFKTSATGKVEETGLMSLEGKMSSSETLSNVLTEMKAENAIIVKNFFEDLEKLRGTSNFKDIYNVFSKYEKKLKIKINKFFTADELKKVIISGDIQGLITKINSNILSKQQELFTKVKGQNRLSLYLTPDLGRTAGVGDDIVVKYLREDNAILSRADVVKLLGGKKKYEEWMANRNKSPNKTGLRVMMIRNPMTTTHAVTFKNVIVAEEIGIYNKKGIATIDQFDVYGKKEGDYDGDTVSTYLINDLGKKFEAEVMKRQQSEFNLLTGLEKYVPESISLNNMLNIIDSVLTGSKFLNILASKARVVESMNSMDLNVKVRIKDGEKIGALYAGNKKISPVLEMPGVAEGNHKLLLDDNLKEELRIGIQQAVDSAKYKNFSESQFSKNPNHFYELMLPNEVKDIDDDIKKALINHIKKIERVLQTPFKLEKSGEIFIPSIVTDKKTGKPVIDKETGEPLIKKVKVKITEGLDWYTKEIEPLLKDNETVKRPTPQITTDLIKQIKTLDDPREIKYSSKTNDAIMNEHNYRESRAAEIINTYFEKHPPKIDSTRAEALDTTIGVYIGEALTAYKKELANYRILRKKYKPEIGISKEYYNEVIAKRKEEAYIKLQDSIDELITKIDELITKTNSLGKEDKKYIVSKFMSQGDIHYKGEKISMSYDKDLNSLISKVFVLSPKINKAFELLYAKLPENAVAMKTSDLYKTSDFAKKKNEVLKEFTALLDGDPKDMGKRLREIFNSDKASNKETPKSITEEPRQKKEIPEYKNIEKASNTKKKKEEYQFYLEGVDPGQYNSFKQIVKNITSKQIDTTDSEGLKDILKKRGKDFRIIDDLLYTSQTSKISSDDIFEAFKKQLLIDRGVIKKKSTGEVTEKNFNDEYAKYIKKEMGKIATKKKKKKYTDFPW